MADLPEILDTIVVKFGDTDDDDSFFSKVELDPAMNGLDEDGNEKTTFYDKEPIWLRVQLHPGFIIDRITNTSGDVENHGLKNHSKSAESVFFSDSEPQDLDFYPSSTASGSEFYGRSSGFTKYGDKAIICESPPVICNLDYNFFAYSLEVIPPNGIDPTKEKPWLLGVVIWAIES